VNELCIVRLAVPPHTPRDMQYKTDA
jgi:hypothetical protein